MLMLMASGVPVFDHIEAELETRPEYIVISPVYEELLKISQTGSPTERRKALIALRLLADFCKVLPYELREKESVDEAIIRYAKESGAIVATNDRTLRAKLRKLGIPEAYLREESRRVVVEGYYK